MAAACDPVFLESDEDFSDSSREDASDPEACRYYNGSGCRNGTNCQHLHVCRYALQGNCRYGSKCKFSHNLPPSAASRARLPVVGQPAATGYTLNDGRLYQWQLNDGKGWKDIENDHIIEAQYSLPHNKSIKIYNTQYGAVSIEFKSLTVKWKNLNVRHLDDGRTQWVWYCMLHHKWVKYGDKDKKGNVCPVSSSDIEQKFRTNPRGSLTFNIGTETYEIRFEEMLQVGRRGKAKVTRRPLYRSKQPAATIGAPQVLPMMQGLSLGSSPEWQFEGNGGTWHKYKHRRGTPSESSMDSDEIEMKYKTNPQDSFPFIVSGQTYKIDFKAMIQTNLKTQNTRRIRRVLV